MSIFRLLRSIEYRIKKIYLHLYGLPFKKFGKNIDIWFPLTIIGKENIEIGDNVSINSFVHIWGNGGVKIGNNVLIASHCSIISVTHSYGKNVTPRFSKVIKKEVIIEDEVWLGSGVKILPGIRIGKGAIIGAGAVVTHDIKPYTIAVGVPAKETKNYNLFENGE